MSESHSPLSVVSEAKGYYDVAYLLRMSLGVPYLAILTRILPKRALAGIAGL